VGVNMRRQKRRLGLRKETLRALALDDAHLARVAGGSTLCATGSPDKSLPDMDASGASLSGSRKC